LLNWLNKLNIQPPPCHHSELTDLQPTTLHSLCNIVHQVITWTNYTTLPLKIKPNTLPNYLTTATLFYKLLFILETLLLAPIPKHQINIKA
jgi:hypothetical protein